VGAQTVAIFSLGVRAVFTTAATATWAALMGDLSDWARSRKERRRLALVVAALFVGAVAGGLLIDNAPIWAPVLPLTLTAAVVAVAALRFGDELAPPRQARRRPDEPQTVRAGGLATTLTMMCFVSGWPLSRLWSSSAQSAPSSGM
jgi:hypothetical protein